MSRYFFHVLDRNVYIDTIGVEFPDLDGVRKDAVSAAGSMIKDGQQWTGQAWRMVVADETGTIVFSVSMSVDRHGH
jgi:hypothetical protein